MRNLTNLPVRESTRNRLSTFGLEGESYDKILLRLMEIAEEKTFWGRQARILKESRFHSMEV